MMNKKLFYIWLLVSCLCSCNHGSEDPYTPPTPPGPGPGPEPTPDSVLVAVELYTSLLSRNAVDQFDETPIGIAVGKHSEEITEVWNGTATNGHIILSPEKYYPTDSTTLFLRGFYPQTSLEKGKADYALTGKEDILYANEQSGSLTTPFTAETTPLTFRHLLAQLSINIQTNATFPEGYRLKSFHVKGSSGSTSLDVLTGELHFDGQPTILPVYSGNEGETLVPGTPLSLGSVLIEPGAILTADFILTSTEPEGKEISFNDLPIEFEGGEAGGGLSYKLDINLPDDPDPDDPDPDDPDPDDPDPDDPDPDDPDPDDPDPDDPDPDDPENPGTIQLTAILIPWIEGNNGTGGILR